MIQFSENFNEFQLKNLAMAVDAAKMSKVTQKKIFFIVGKN